MLKQSLWLIFGLAFSLSSAHACPVINGNFENANGTSELTIATRMEQGKPSYNVTLDGEGPYYVADGVERPIDFDGYSGTVKMSCSGNTIEFHAKVDGEGDVTIRYVVTNNDQLEVTSSEADLNGRYNRVSR